MMKTLRRLSALVAFCLAAIPAAPAQTVNAAQAVTTEGLLAANGHGGFKAAAFAPDGTLILLADQHDGIRIYKSDGAATQVLASAHMGATGDSGLAMALDAAGDIYITGTSTSGALSGTAGAAYPNPADTSTNSFVARFDANLNLVFLSFLGAGRTAATAIAATSDSVFVTGLTYSNTFPVTPSAIGQTPASGTTQNGFVERLSADGSRVVYATYLTGYGGSTSPAAIAADPADNAYIAGATSASGYPTVAGLVPRIFGANSGFLTKLTPAGDGITFSTFISGTGLTSAAFDPSTSSLLLTGNVSLSQFPVATAAMPLAATTYQTLLRIPADGQSVTSSVILVPGTSSFVTPAPNGAAWVSGTLSEPLFPGAVQPDFGLGDSCLVHVTATGVLDQTLRFGGAAYGNSSYSTLTTTPAAPAVSADGATAVFDATITTTVAASIAATQRFDLPLTNAPNTLLPSTLRDVSTTCGGGQCSGSGGLLAEVRTGASLATLALSIDPSPNITVRNLGSVTATGLSISASGFTVTTDCAPTLDPSNACHIALTGAGPGTLTVSAADAPTQTVILPASTTPPDPLQVSAPELDLGVVTGVAPVTRTFTVSNLTATAQTFTSAVQKGTVTAFALNQTTTDCTPTGVTNTYTLAPNAACHITLSVTASSANANDGPIHAAWSITPAAGATQQVQLAGFAQAAAITVSASEIDFGTQFSGTSALRSPRYLFLSNNSPVAYAHDTVALPSTSPFTITDECPSVLEPHTVCRLAFTYNAASAPSADSTQLTVDGLPVLLTGTTLQPAGVTGSVANPSLTITPSTVTFGTPVTVTAPGADAQAISIHNTGNSAIPLNTAVSGDFVLSNGCPAVLTGGAACTLQVSFAPSAAGTRNGLVSVTGGSGFAPAYVTLTGTATDILPANNGILDLGQTYVGEPLIAWYKIQQPLTSLTATTGSPAFGVALVEDTGSGHGTLPASAFTETATGSCRNCWLGVEFLSGAAGTQISTLSLSSATGGNPEVVSVTAQALPVSGLLLTPITQDFGPIDVGSTSAPLTFTLADLLPSSTAVNIRSVTVSGDFQVVSNTLGGPACAGQLASTSACFIGVSFTPTATGERSGILSVATDSGTITAALTGFGEPSPGFTLSPAALVFNNVPGPSATTQTITFTNTSNITETLAPATTTNTAFSVADTCATVAPNASCTLTVTYTPGTSAATGSLLLPVTSTANGQTSTTTYSLALQGTYAAVNAGLLVLPNIANFGSLATGALGLTREFTLLNFSAKTLNITLQMPRQFPLADPGACTLLAPGATCVFSVSFLPATTGEATGSVTVLGTPTDNSPALQTIAYMIGYGQGTGSLNVSGAFIPGAPLTFGQLNSGQTTQQVVTLTNNGLSTVHVRRITSEPPFLSTNTCAAPLAPNATCAITLTYAPTDEVSTSSGVTVRTDTGALIIESDSATSPYTVALEGRVQSLGSSSPASPSVLATFALSESALTFANTQVGNASPTQTVTLTNTGTRALQVSAVLFPPDFTGTYNCSTLLPGNSCTLTVQFTPGAASTAAARSGTVEIQTDGATSLEYISLLGASTPSPLTFTPATLTFGTVNVGASSQLTVTVTNTSATPITFNGVTASGDYTVGRGTCPANGATLAAGSSCVLSVTFKPTTTGVRTGTLSLYSDATQLPLTVALTGNAVASQLTANPSALAFGPIAVRSPANLTLTLLNSGSAPVTGLASTLTGPDAADFAVTVPCPITTLAPNQACSVTVTFTPSHLGPESATLAIASSDPNSPLLVPLSGSGAQPGGFTLTVDGGPSATQTVKSGSPAIYTLVITPTGGFTGSVALTCTPTIPAEYASCSVLQSQISLANGPVTSMATINTITSLATRSIAFAGIFALLPWWRRRTTRRWVANALIALSAILSLAAITGCGGGKNNNLRYSPPGAYQWQVTASSTSGPVISQTVTLNLIIQ